MRLCDHCHSKTKEGGKGKEKLKDTTDIFIFPQANPHQYCGRINRICGVMIIISTKNKTMYYCYCPCQQNKKLRLSNKMWARKTVHWEFYEELFSYAAFTLRVFGEKVEAKAVKGGCISIFPQQAGKNLFPELFRGLMECTTAKHGDWDCAALSWRLNSEFFSLKTQSFLLPGSLTPPKIFLYYTEIPVKSLDSAAMT